MVQSHRRANNLDWKDIERQVEDEWCRQTDTGSSHCVQCEAPEAHYHTTAEQVRQFAAFVSEWLKGGGKWVDQEEAESRASICSTCPLNIKPEACGPCGELSKLVVLASNILAGKKTSKDKELKSCGVCGCQVRVAVHVPIEPLKKSHGDLKFPDYCWQK